MYKIKRIAEELLGRKVQQADGISASEIEKAEICLGFDFPEVLRYFYLLIGNQPLFMSSFQRILKPDEVYREGDKVVFAEENQNVCYWGIQLQDIFNEEIMVFQCNNDGSLEWYSEKINLGAFLKLLLYYQCAQGGYEYSGYIGRDFFMDKKEQNTFFQNLNENWEKVVDHNHLIIYCKEGKLIWYFTDEKGEVNMEYSVLASTRTETALEELINTYDFVEL